MKILLTWTSWFIWRNLILKLKNDWYEVFWLLRKRSNKEYFINNNLNYFCFEKYDEVLDFFKKERFDLVIHLATLYLIWNTFDEIDDLIESNITFWTKIIEIASLTEVKHFINTSSFIQNYENKNYSPVNLYAATKQSFEDIWKYYSESKKINFCSLSLVNSYWPWDERKKIFNIWKDSLEKKETIKSTSWEQFIDILFISDVLNAYSCLIKEIENWNSIDSKKFAISSNEVIKLKDLAKIFEKVVWKRINIQWWTLQHRDREVMYPYNIWEKVPNWKQIVSLEQGIGLFLNS